jgi:ZIP family zinc transporter
VSPLATVVLVSGVAALAAGLGAVPQALGRTPTPPMIGWANALAAGLMLGVAYTLLTEGLDLELLAGGGGAFLGIVFARGAHAAAGTGELDADPFEGVPRASGSKLILVDTLHAADEGIAIGVAMAVSLPLGVAMALTLGVHNVPEAMVLSTSLVRRGASPGRTALIAVGVNLSQVALAVAAFAAIAAGPWLLPWLTGFAVGAMIYRTLVELLPESYHQAGETSIAMVTLLAAGVVVLLAGAAG